MTDTRCPRCGSSETVVRPGTGPHFAKLVCAKCGRWLQWLPRPDMPSATASNPVPNRQETEPSNAHE